MRCVKSQIHYIISEKSIYNYVSYGSLIEYLKCFKESVWSDKKCGKTIIIFPDNPFDGFGSWPKPPFSYIALITMAITSKPGE